MSVRCIPAYTPKTTLVVWKETPRSATLSKAVSTLQAQVCYIICRRVFLSAGRRVFSDFLRSEYSEENLLFWLACEDLREEQNYERVKEKARQIYEDYVSILSPREVSTWETDLLAVKCIMCSSVGLGTESRNCVRSYFWGFSVQKQESLYEVVRTNLNSGLIKQQKLITELLGTKSMLG